MNSLSFGEICSVVGTVAAVCAAFFSGWTAVHAFFEKDVRVIPRRDGRLMLNNPSEFPVTIRNIVFKDCTLWDACSVSQYYEQVFGDTGKINLMLDERLYPEETRTFQFGACVDGERKGVRAKVRRVHFFQRTLFDVLVFADERLIDSSEPEPQEKTEDRYAKEKD